MQSFVDNKEKKFEVKAQMHNELLIVEKKCKLFRTVTLL